MKLMELYEEIGWLMNGEYADPECEIWIDDPSDFNNPRRAERVSQMGERVYIIMEEKE